MKQTLLCALLGFVFLTAGSGFLPGYNGDTADQRKLNAIDPLREDVADFLNEDLESVLLTGTRNFREGRYLDAARCFLFVLRRDADNCGLMFLLSECYARLGHPKPATRFLNRSMNAGFTDTDRIRSSRSFTALMANPGFRKNRANILKWGEAHGKEILVVSRRLEPVRIHLPRKYDPHKAYTLLIGLHGNGDNGGNFARIWRHFGRRDFIFAVPRGAYEKPSSRIVPGQRFSWDLETRNKALWKKADPLVLQNILEVRDHVSQSHHIKETYILGFSQGAAYTYAAAIRHPDKIRGIICFAGILPPADKPWSLFTTAQLQSARTLRVFIAHGRADGAIGITKSEKIHATLRGLGYACEFHPFDGGHLMPPKMLKKAVDWMMKE